MFSSSRRSADASRRGRRRRNSLALGLATVGALTATVFAGGPASADVVNTPLHAEYVGGNPRCMDDFGGLTNDGNGVQIHVCNGTVAQRWTLVESGSTVRNQGKCLHARGNGTANGTPLELWTCNGTGSEVFIPFFDVHGAGALYNPQSDKCVDIPGNAYISTYIELYDCNGSTAQVWHTKE